MTSTARLAVRRKERISHTDMFDVHTCACPTPCPFRRQRDLARQNEMAERERQTQELLKSCEVGDSGCVGTSGSIHVHTKRDSSGTCLATLKLVGHSPSRCQAVLSPCQC